MSYTFLPYFNINTYILQLILGVFTIYLHFCILVLRFMRPIRGMLIYVNKPIIYKEVHMPIKQFKRVTSVVYYLYTFIFVVAVMGIIYIGGYTIIYEEFSLEHLLNLLMPVITLSILEVEIINFRKIALNLSSEEPISETVASAFKIISRCLFLQGVVWLIFNITVYGPHALYIYNDAFPENPVRIGPVVTLYFSLFFSAMSSLFGKISASNVKQGGAYGK